jgi:16S rRNA (uracil1498-N3)-methyltransferase
MNRFFVPPGTTAAERFPLPGSIAHQVRRVLRLRDGDRVALLEGDGRLAVCRVAGDDCVVEERREVGGEPRHRLTVCQALLKGDALDHVVRQGTEIGVAAFRLVLTERCVAREVSDRRLERLRAIAREAAEQSERGVVPGVDAPVPLREMLAPESVVLYERNDGITLGQLPPPASIVIGPEGGLSPAEVEAAQAVGATLAGLGPRILRAESVALSAATVVLARAGDFA